jgi:23S rRNA (uracil1939-C5)-methyltransferase
MSGLSNKAFMPVGKGKNGLEFGIYERWSHKIVPHKTCFLHPPEFDLIAHRCLELMDNAKVQPYDETSHTGTLRNNGFRCSKYKKQILRFWLPEVLSNLSQFVGKENDL